MNDPFSAFVMSEWHRDEVEAIVRREELEAVPFQVECPGPRGAHAEIADYPWLNGCSHCGAAV